MADTKYLQQHHNTWIFKKRLPEKARHLANGSNFYTKSLETGDIREARKRRDVLLGELQQQIDSIIGGDERSTYRWWLSLLENDKPENAQAVAEEIEADREGLPAQRAANTYLSGKEYPEYGYSLKDATASYKLFKESRLKSKKDIGKADLAVSSFLASIKVNDVPLESVRRRQVADWLEGLDKSGKTKKNYISALIGVWKRAEDMEEVSGNNPFAGHTVSTSDTQSYQMFTDEELEAVFKVVLKESGERRLIPLLGLATGCRIEELCQLRVDDLIEDGERLYIQIREGKTKAAERVVPVHSAVAEQLRVWAGGREGWLFDLKETGGKRSHALSKWFGRIKSKVVGADRSKSFHSLRVHMATAFERAGVVESTAAWILGHERKMTMSYGVYSKGMAWDQLTEAVEAIQLPDWLTA